MDKKHSNFLQHKSPQGTFTESLVDTKLLKYLLPIFSEYDYMDLCRAVFCVNAWRGNRPELVIAMTLNKALAICDKSGSKSVKTYRAFSVFFDSFKKIYKQGIPPDKTVPDWGEVFITLNNEFYPVFMGNGYNYVFATMQCIPIVAKLLEKEDLVSEVMRYLRNMIHALAAANTYDKDNSYGDLYIPSKSFFKVVCDYYEPLESNSVPKGIEQLLLNSISIDTTHFAKQGSQLFPLFNASILVDAYTNLLSLLPANTETAQHIVYSVLYQSLCLDEKTLLLRNAEAIESINSVKAINGYTDGIFIIQGSRGILFVDEIQLNENELTSYRRKLLLLHKSDKLIIKGLNIDNRVAAVKVAPEYDFEVIAFDEIINCGMPFAKGLSSSDLFRFMTLELVYFIVSSDDLEELFQFVRYTINPELERHLCYDGRCAEFEAWRLTHRQVIRGVLEGTVYFELNLPEYIKWEKYRDALPKFYPDCCSELFAYPENWKLIAEEDGHALIKNRAIHRLVGWIKKLQDSYIYLDLSYAFYIEDLEPSYGDALPTISELINKGLHDYQSVLEERGFFPKGSGIHVFYLSSMKAQVRICSHY